MIEICNKNISCCGCSEMDTCTKKKQVQLYKDFFTLYGNYQEKYTSKQFYISAEHPNNIHTEKEVLKALKSADENIEKLELYIAMLQSYKIELVNRYNYLMTTPTKEKILLQRYKKYNGKVFYYIRFYSVDLTIGEETETDTKTYKGTERKQAFSDFENLKKEHTNAIFETDTEKKHWEK